MSFLINNDIMCDRCESVDSPHKANHVCSICFEQLTQSPWVSFKDEKPPANERLLITNGREYLIHSFSKYVQHYHYILQDSGIQFKKPTHWMHIPELTEGI